MTSTYDKTLMCVIDEKTRLIYQAALERYLQVKFFTEIFLKIDSESLTHYLRIVRQVDRHPRSNDMEPCFMSIYRNLVCQ